MNFIYQALKTYNHRKVIVHEEPTEKEIINWLENNSGGIYRNVLYNFETYIPPKNNGVKK